MTPLPAIAAELGKVAVQKLAEVKAEDAARAVKALSRSSLSVATLLPGVGAFAAGVALGAGLGVLFAPRSGSETRAAIKQRLGKRWQALTGRSAAATR